MTQITLLKDADMFTALSTRKEDIMKMIGGELNYKREVSFAIQAVNSNTYLQKASKESIAKSIFNVATTRLSLNPILKLAYITPRRVNDNWEAVLMPSYQGLVKLIADTGSVISIYAHPVYKGDEYEEILGTETKVVHIKKRKSKQIELVYAVAVLPDGTKLVESMDVEDVHKIRARSDSYRAYASDKISTCIWVTDEGEMFRKTVIKRISKYIPKTDRWIHVQEAINLDDQEYPATNQQKDFIEMLINHSVYDSDVRTMLLSKINNDISQEEANRIIEDLKINQLDPINAGNPYNQTDIKNKLQNEIKSLMEAAIKK